MPKAEYRSAIRSRSLIKKAIAKLIHEKDINKITVSDVIREADISRGTFYAHYTDIYSVIEQIQSEEISNLNKFIDKFYFDASNTGEFEEFIKEICSYLAADKEYYALLTNSNIFVSFIDRVRKIYFDRISSYLLENNQITEKSKAETYMIFVTSGAKDVLISWLNGDIHATTEEIANSLATLITYCKTFYR